MITVELFERPKTAVEMAVENDSMQVSSHISSILLFKYLIQKDHLSMSRI